MRLVHSGVDTLHLSARGDVAEAYAHLLALRTLAEDAGEARRGPDAAGFAFEVLPHGSGRYRVVLECAEFRLLVTDSARIPSVRLELRSVFVHTLGVDGAWRSALRAAEEVVGVPLRELKVARIDLCADFAGWRLRRDDWGGLVRHAKVRAFGEPAPGEVETFQIGKTPLLVRLYRKDIEARERKGFAPVFWDVGAGEPVVRVEVQAGAENLRGYRFSSVEETLASCGDIWRNATTRFVTLRVPSAGPRERWALRPEWEAVQAVAFEKFAHTGIVPAVVWIGDRDRALGQVYGWVTTLGSLEGIDDLGRMLALLPAELAPLAEKKCYAAEVERKRRRRSQWERGVLVDSVAASAGAGSEEVPCAPEHSQPDTAARTST